MKIGEYLLESGDIVINAGKKTVALSVANISERPIQVGSHIHFFEVNRGLSFDRKAAYGYRLDIPAGTAVRFEPGQTKKVGLVEIGGKRKVMGANNLVDGFLDEKRAAAEKNAACFLGEDK